MTFKLKNTRIGFLFTDLNNKTIMKISHLPTKSHFRNWFYSYGRSKPQDLSETFAASIKGNVDSTTLKVKKLTIKFEDSYGKQIEFILSESDAENFMRQINIIKAKY